MYYAIIRVPETFEPPTDNPLVTVPYSIMPGTRTYYNEQLTIACSEDDAALALMGDVLCLRTKMSVIIPLDKSANNFTKYWGANVPPEQCNPGIFAGIPWITV